MFVYHRTSRNTGVGVGGCLGAIIVFAMSWAILGLLALTFAAALWVLVAALVTFLAWVLLWVVPVSIYRGMLDEGWGVPASSGAACAWAVLVVALAGWIAL